MNRNIIITNDEYYHIYNRGVDRREIFLDKEDFWKFFNCLRDFNNTTGYEERLDVLGISKNSVRDLQSFDFKNLGGFLQQQKKVIDIISYSFNPNHFHLATKQLKDSGVSNFMQKVGTAYTNYFNKKYKRSGALFQGTFKAVHVDNEEYLLWLLGYINGNIEIHKLGKAADYPWSSYRAIRSELNYFLKRKQGQSLSNLSNLSILSGLEDIVLSQFNSIQEFDDFMNQVILESRNKKEMEKYLIETEETQETQEVVKLLPGGSSLTTS